MRRQRGRWWKGAPESSKINGISKDPAPDKGENWSRKRSGERAFRKKGSRGRRLPSSRQKTGERNARAVPSILVKIVSLLSTLKVHFDGSEKKEHHDNRKYRKTACEGNQGIDGR